MSLTAVQAEIFLHHLEIQSSNPERLANFYSNIMDMKIDKLSLDKFICDGPSHKNFSGESLFIFISIILE